MWETKAIKIIFVFLWVVAIKPLPVKHSYVQHRRYYEDKAVCVELIVIQVRNALTFEDERNVEITESKVYTKTQFAKYNRAFI